jgi:hypothetical protein
MLLSRVICGILSPLRLPVPPSRLYVEVIDYTAYFKPKD